jgi:hypothetical protein
MTTNESIDAAFTALGWTYDRGDELWRDRDGQLIAPENVIAALPPDASLDDLAAYEDWKRPQLPRPW